MMAIRKKRKTHAARRWRLHLLTVAWCVLALGALGAVVGKWKCGAVGSSGVDESTLERMCTVALPDSVADEEVRLTGFTVHFNRLRHVPNYVAYRLKGATMEEKPASSYSGPFLAADSVTGCPSPQDYAKSGYQRGHMAPAADMKWSADALKDSYVMLNICPQREELNAGAWRRLEEKVREWAQRDRELVVITGPIWKGERPLSPSAIGKGKVAVPTHFFKVVAAPYARPMRAIAFVMPNADVADAITHYAVSVDEVERLTGFDFFRTLPEEVQCGMEKSVNVDGWFQF